MDLSLILFTVAAFIIGAISAFTIAHKSRRKLLDAAKEQIETLESQVADKISKADHLNQLSQLEQNNAQLNSQLEGLQDQVIDIQNQADEKEAAYTQEYQTKLNELVDSHQSDRKILKEQLDQVEIDLADLADLLVTFERWHESLTQLMLHNAEMHKQN